MDNLWIFLVLIYALLKGGREGMKKAAVKKSGTNEILFLYTFVGFLMTIPYYKTAFSLSGIYIFYSFIKAACCCVAGMFSLFAIKRMSVSLYGVMDLSRMVFSTLLGIIVLGEDFTVDCVTDYIENGVATAVRRDTHEKVQLNLNNIEKEVQDLLANIQNNMYRQAEENFNNAIVETDDFDTLVNEINNKKVALSYHCGNKECEEEIKNRTTIKTRVIHSYDTDHKCVYCGKKSEYRVYFGKQY